MKCARARCKTCPFIRNVEKISGPKRSIKITDHFTCTSANVIYCKTCTLCKKLYIGETGRRLGDRFREHLRDVEKDDQNASKPVARHFNLPNHSKGRTIRKVMGGGGGKGEFSACTNFFFCSLPVQEFFFRVKPSARIFFQANIAFFSVKSRFIIYFALNKLFYTHNRSKDTGHFLILCARSFRKCTERGGSNPEWTASLCIFAVPAFWISSVIKMG